MESQISLQPLTKNLFKTYIAIGSKAYNQHYLHLWPKGDSTPYLQSSFTENVLLEEEGNPNTALFLILWNTSTVGILKLSYDRGIGVHNNTDAMLLDKIYIMTEYSGKGIGKEVLQLVMKKAIELDKKIVWLETMQNGTALKFYLQNGFEIFGESQVPFKMVIEKEKLMYIMMRLV